MADIAVFCEGRLDEIVLLALREAGHLPGGLSVRQRPKGTSDDRRCVVAAADQLNLGNHAISLIDRNGHTPEARFAWAANVVEEIVREKCTHVPADRTDVAIVTAANRIAPIAIVLVGLPGHAHCGYRPKAFTMDDYMLSIACDTASYDALRTKDRDLVDHARVMDVMTKVVALLDANGIPVEDAKRMCLLLRALANFESSLPTFAERLMRVCVHSAQVFAPLIADLTRANELLRAT